MVTPFNGGIRRGRRSGFHSHLVEVAGGARSVARDQNLMVAAVMFGPKKEDEGQWSGLNTWAQRTTGPVQIVVSIGPRREKMDWAERDLT
jgi:hypothetical protein